MKIEVKESDLKDLSDDRLIELMCYGNKAREIFNKREKEHSLSKFKEQYKVKYLKYRSNYSCLQKESDYWYIYVYVKEVKENVMAESVSIEKDNYNHITIKSEIRPVMLSYYEEISKEEYLEEVSKLFNEIENLFTFE